MRELLQILIFASLPERDKKTDKRRYCLILASVRKE